MGQQWSNKKKNKGSGAWKQQPEWRKADATSDNEGIVMDGETKIAMDEKVIPSEKEKSKIEDEEKAIGKDWPKISYDSKVIPPEEEGEQVHAIWNPPPEEDSKERVAFPSYHDKSKRIFFPALKKKQWQQDNLKNWKKKSNWNDQWDNNKLRKNTDWNDDNAKQVEGFENQDHQGNKQTKKELLTKELEDEAFQKLRELDRKILKLQAEALKEQEEENNKMKRKWIFF